MCRISRKLLHRARYVECTYTHIQQRRQQQQQRGSEGVRVSFCVTVRLRPVVDMSLHGEHGAAWRRRQRRLRSWWRHEQQSVAMALSAAAHHSFDKVAAGEKYDGRGGCEQSSTETEVQSSRGCGVLRVRHRRGVAWGSCRASAAKAGPTAHSGAHCRLRALCSHGANS